MKRIFKNQFVIKGHRTGSRLLGRENQIEYVVYTKDGSRKVKGGFFKWKDADRWLSKSVKIANMVMNEKGVE